MVVQSQYSKLILMLEARLERQRLQLQETELQLEQARKVQALSEVKK